jgi:hypothetical protein
MVHLSEAARATLESPPGCYRALGLIVASPALPIQQELHQLHHSLGSEL